MFGNIVAYKLTASNAAQVNALRQDAVDYRASIYRTGYVVYEGEPVVEGQRLPLVVVIEADDKVSGQVLLPGSDVLYVQDIELGDANGQYDFLDTESV